MRQLREIFNAITPYHVRKRGLRIRVPCMLSLVDIHAQSVLTSAAYSHAFASLFLPTSNLFSWTSMYERANNYIFIYCSHISCPSSGVWVSLTQIGLHCNGPKCPCSKYEKVYNIYLTYEHVALASRIIQETRDTLFVAF